MKKAKQTRSEKDSLGTVKVPKDAYFGAFTVRAYNNFQISGITSPEIFMKSIGMVKLAALRANARLKLIPAKKAKAIEKAALEFVDGKFADSFITDVFQAGAGTSYNMNCNEVIANRANEILKGKKGTYEHIHPNNHVNMAQSTNDTIPTASRLAVLMLHPELIDEIKKLEKSFDKLAKKHAKTIKVGRTHLQDAVPITLGQEFDSYKEALQKSRKQVEQQAKELDVLGIGGTAVGTGINTHPSYQKEIIKELSKLAKRKFRAGKNLTEMANNMNAFMNYSAALRSLAVNLLNICMDLKMMNMGPKAGLAEIVLPEVQPGSSIMPGKINPSIPESIEMVAFHVLGNDKTIEMSCQRSNFELNVMCPIIMYNLVQSSQILSGGLRTLREKCVDGIKVNEDHLNDLYENSLATATALAPYVGYATTSDIVKQALKKGISIREETKSRNLYTDKELNEILSIKGTTKPRKINEKLIRKSQ